MNNATSENENGLKKRWEQFRTENPQVRIRDAAEKLGTSEAELLATEIGEKVVRLSDDFDNLLQEFHALGRVMALTRNAAVVHERKGEYAQVEVFDAHGKMGLVLGEDIDLRIFFKNWHFGFAVTSENELKTLHSFQFFDVDGTAVHKVFLTETSDHAAYQKLVEKYRSENQSQSLDVSAKPSEANEKPDSEIDVEGFQKAWSEMKDTHDFFGMTKKFDVSRRQALRLANREMAFQVPVETYQYLLKQASGLKLPVMIFVSNSGIIQIHTGEVEKVVEARGWFNVLDEKFNLHIRQSEIASAWIVRKPTVDGIVSSLEIFNEQGENIALFFGKRKPGMSENTEWRDLLETFREIKTTKNSAE